jgi:hypothetical protein
MMLFRKYFYEEDLSPLLCFASKERNNEDKWQAFQAMKKQTLLLQLMMYAPSGYGADVGPSG